MGADTTMMVLKVIKLFDVTKEVNISGKED